MGSNAAHSPRQPCALEGCRGDQVPLAHSTCGGSRLPKWRRRSRPQRKVVDIARYRVHRQARLDMRTRADVEEDRVLRSPPIQPLHSAAPSVLGFAVRTMRYIHQSRSNQVPPIWRSEGPGGNIQPLGYSSPSPSTPASLSIHARVPGSTTKRWALAAYQGRQSLRPEMARPTPIQSAIISRRYFSGMACTT